VVQTDTNEIQTILSFFNKKSKFTLLSQPYLLARRIAGEICINSPSSLKTCARTDARREEEEEEEPRQEKSEKVSAKRRSREEVSPRSYTRDIPCTA